ncbi:MAG: DEAD/DEAH box helicase, partial [Terriglobia bacterium]
PAAPADAGDSERAGSRGPRRHGHGHRDAHGGNRHRPRQPRHSDSTTPSHSAPRAQQPAAQKPHSNQPHKQPAPQRQPAEDTDASHLPAFLLRPFSVKA